MARLLHTWVTAQARQRPDAIAVVLGGERVSYGELPERLATVFLEHPWRDADLPALVYEDRGGAVIGFLGVIPRPMSLDGVPLRAAVSTRLMVQPGHRGAAALRLLQTFLRGAQDLSLADSASAASRVLWERLGGEVAANYGLQWCRPLAPVRAALAGLAIQRRSRLAARLAGTVGPVADAALRWLPGAPFQRRPSRFTGEALSTEALLDCLEARAAGYALRPRYTASSLAWLLGVLQRKAVSAPPRAGARPRRGDRLVPLRRGRARRQGAPPVRRARAAR